MQTIWLKEDIIAKKVIIVAKVLARFKNQTYTVTMILDVAGDIIHANCKPCPAGAGPTCTCKHTAALCHAMVGFVKMFVLPEDIQSCTG